MNPQPLLPLENVQNESNPQEIIVQENEINYSQYTNINQLEPKIIKQIDDKTFIIRKSGDDAVDFFIAGLICLITGIYFFSEDWGTKKIDYYFVGAVFIILAIIFFVIFPFRLISLQFTLGPNNITMVQKNCLIKYATIFEAGQLTKLEIITQRINECCTNFKYKIISTQNKDGASSDICHFSDKVKNITYREVGYFNYIMKHHIETKMRH